MRRFLLPLVFALAACSADPVPQPLCTPGASSACTCTNGATGAQVCDVTRVLSACVCVDASTPTDLGADAPDAPDAGPTVDTPLADAAAMDVAPHAIDVPPSDLGASDVPRADATDAGDAADVAVPRCVFNFQCGALPTCVDGCCATSPDAGMCEPPRPTCVADTDCGSDRLCYRGACRRRCSPPDGSTSDECQMFDVQFNLCVADSMGRGVCTNAREQSPQCARTADCTAGRRCVDARCE